MAFAVINCYTEFSSRDHTGSNDLEIEQECVFGRESKKGESLHLLSVRYMPYSMSFATIYCLI